MYLDHCRSNTETLSVSGQGKGDKIFFFVENIYSLIRWICWKSTKIKLFFFDRFRNPGQGTTWTWGKWTSRIGSDAKYEFQRKRSSTETWMGIRIVSSYKWYTQYKQKANWKICKLEIQFWNVQSRWMDFIRVRLVPFKMVENIKLSRYGGFGETHMIDMARFWWQIDIGDNFGCKSSPTS